MVGLVSALERIDVVNPMHRGYVVNTKVVVICGIGASACQITTLHHENSAVVSFSRDLMFGKVADVIAHDHIIRDISSSVCGRGVYR